MEAYKDRRMCAAEEAAIERYERRMEDAA